MPEFAESIPNIKPGTFARDASNVVYRSRLLYTKFLREYVYNPIAMNIILTHSSLKELFFRTFGYKGKLNFTIYPALWLRDLAVLDFGDDVYMGDGILLGTNQVSPDQKSIKVGPIVIGSRTVLDQQCAIGLGSRIGEDCTFGFRASVGLKANIGNRVNVGGSSIIAHCVKIGNDVAIGQGAFIHDFAVIEDGARICDGIHIPRFSLVSKSGEISSRKRS